MAVKKIKEKCKDAARMRREKERAEFVELSKLLPLPSSVTSQLDKASVIRLTSCYLKMRSAFPRGLGHNWGGNSRHQHQQHHLTETRYSNSSQSNSCESSVRELGSLLLQTLDGFVFALHKDGKIMYISETASVLLGLPQIDLAGSSIFDYVLPSDHNDILDALSLSEAERIQLDSTTHQTGEIEVARAFCVRMKCILPKRNAGLVNGGHKAIHCNGYLKLKLNLPPPGMTNSTGSYEGEWEKCALVAVGHSLLPTASTEVKLNASSFMFRANLDLSLYFIEASFAQLLEFEQMEMTGQSLYKFVHTSDLASLEGSHKSLLDKGQVVTRYCRLMKRTGGCMWVQCHATLVNNPRNMPKPQHVVSVCHILADESMIDGSCMLSESCSQQVTLQSSDQHNTEQKLAPTESHTDKPYNQFTEERQLHVSKRPKKFKISSEEVSCGGFAEDNESNLIYSTTYPISNPVEGHSYMTIGSTRRISDDTSSMVSSVASTQVLSSSTVSVTLAKESDPSLGCMVADTGLQEYYLRTSNESCQQNLEQANNSLELLPCSYQDIYTQYLNCPTTEEETTLQFNSNSNVTANVSPYTKQIPVNDNPSNYNQLINLPQDFCLCSSSPDWTNYTGSPAKCNPPLTCQTKHLAPFHSNIFHHHTDTQSSRHSGERALSHYSDYTYCVDTPYLIQYHQQVPINNSYTT